ncbi:RTA1-domain-containing protein [Byssothecium circinans]|uniref:RTA1-domain-containing protein n=1 Tax=Byssothecium circinans TaxID=147558 RepID=A0A6A5TUG4_9PLEO|nr:RTA1-domain-containing protein [Byssothecium circinans]
MSETKEINDTTHFVYYRYHPSLPAAVIFVVLFAFTTILHVFQIVKKRTWYFIPLAIGGIFQTIGYIGRILSNKNQWAMGPFLIQNLLLLVAPALFAASIYIILGRIIVMVDGERYSVIRQKWLTGIFVTGDILSFLIQGGGGGIMGASDGKESTVKAGERLIIVGLFVQLFFFGAFVAVAGIFHFRLERSRTVTDSTTTSVNIDTLPWKRHLIALYVTSGLILVRSIFRIIEYLQGNAGYLLRHEIYLYIFDAILMLGVMVVFNLIHPSQVTEAHQERLRGSSSGGVTVSESGDDEIEMQRLKEPQGARQWV